MTTLQSQSIELRNDLRQVALLSEWVDRFADEISLPANRRGELQVALEEVVINVIKHGFGADTNRSLTVTLTANQDFVSAEVIDDAAAYNPLARPAIGGLGVHMAKQLMESVKYDRRAAQNVLTLRCHRAPAAAVSSTAGGAR